MSGPNVPILRKHKLSHIPELKIDPVLFDATFASGCSVYSCNAACCRQGVMVDITERDNIFSHAEIIQRRMETHQEKNAAAWFDSEVEHDPDFSSGLCVGTQTREYGCVFLKSGGRCVLQTLAEEEGMPEVALKPFFCFAFPVTIQSGVLTLEDPELANQPQCCSLVLGGELTVFDVCADELKFVLGSGGLQELYDLAQQKPINPRSPTASEL